MARAPRTSVGGILVSDMKDTSSVGNLTEGMVLAGLLQSGAKVLTPFGDGLHYDLLIDDDNKFTRVQCKTGILKNGAVEFRNYTVTSDGKNKSYGDTVDAYGVYCPQNGKVYLVPANKCGTKTTALREAPSKNGQSSGVRLGKDYLIANVQGKEARE